MVIYITRFPPIEHNFLFSWCETYVGSPTGDVSRVISDVGVEPGMSPLSSTAALEHYEHVYLGEVTNSGRSQDSVVKSAKVPRLHRSAGTRTERLGHSGSGERGCAGQPLRSPEMSPT